MVRTHTVRLFPTPEQVDMIELCVAAEMVLHDLLVRNARDEWISSGRVPDFSRWESLIDGLREDNERFSVLDRGGLIRIAGEIHTAVSDAALYCDAEDILDSFPEYYEESDRYGVPLYVGGACSLSFDEHTVCIPGIGDVFFFGNDRSFSDNTEMAVRFTDYSWVLEWQELRKIRPAGWFYRPIEDKDGNVSFIKEQV